VQAGLAQAGTPGRARCAAVFYAAGDAVPSIGRHNVRRPGKVLRSLDLSWEHGPPALRGGGRILPVFLCFYFLPPSPEGRVVFSSGSLQSVCGGGILGIAAAGGTHKGLSKSGHACHPGRAGMEHGPAALDSVNRLFTIPALCYPARQLHQYIF